MILYALYVLQIPKTFKLFGFQIYFAMSVPDEGRAD